MASSPDPFDALERVQAVIVRSNSADEMLAGVLDEMLDLFDCDRAWLLHPCDPKAERFTVPIERTRPEWPGAGGSGESQRVDTFAKHTFERCLECDEPVTILPDDPLFEDGDDILERFHVRSMLVMAIRPAGDDPWLLGIHHCRETREYGDQQPLFRAIGRRVADGLTTFLAMRELRQSEERFRTIVEHAPEAMVIYDLDTNTFDEANEVAARLFGLTLPELLNSGGPADFSPEFQPDGQRSTEAARKLTEAAYRGSLPMFEWLHKSARGQTIPCEVRLVRLPHPTRRLVRGSIVDITERRRAEVERGELEAHLAQSQKMEAIGQLCGGVAHDFNNLLTVILGNLELLDEGLAESETSQRRVADIRSAAQRAQSLTHRLLAFSRRQPLQPSAVEGAELLREMEILLRRTLREDIEIRLSLAADLWQCEVDETQLQNAILNLALNASDAMPDGGSLTIAATNAVIDADYASRHDEVEPGDYVCLAVADSGVGISAANLTRIFSPFFTTKSAAKGSGLGLSMVYGFVKQSRGLIKVDSESGAGTTIRLYLPRATDATVVRDRAASPASDERGDGECVLVVEDDHSVRSLTCTMLRHLGYRVLEAAEANAALEMLARHPEIDLLFTDIVLPGERTGVALADAARALRPELLVLYMSGYSDNAIISQGRVDPDVKLVDKPFTKRALAASVRAVFAARG